MTATTSASKTSVIFAGEIFAGQDPDHPHVRDLAGKIHVVRVRAMPARHLGRVLELCTHEAQLLELVCQCARSDETSGQILEWLPVDDVWVDNLEPDTSHPMLLEAAKRQNFSRAVKWGERQIAAKEFQAPLLLKADEVLNPVVEKMARLLISSLPSSGSAAGPTTKS